MSPGGGVNTTLSAAAVPDLGGAGISFTFMLLFREAVKHGFRAWRVESCV